MSSVKNNKRLYRQSVLLLILLMALALTACRKTKQEQEAAPEAAIATEESIVSETIGEDSAMNNSPEADTEPVETTVPEVKEIEDYVIATPHGNLCFPGEWRSFLTTEQEEGTKEYTVTFFAHLDAREEPQELFSILFNGDPKEADGVVKDAAGKYVAVRGEKVSFSPDETWTDRDINIVYTMQNLMDYVMMGLDLEDSEVLNQSDDFQQEEQQNLAGFAFDTPYLELHYPSKWADNLSIQVVENGAYGVSYYAVIGNHSQKALFTIWFGGEKGSSLKTIKAPSGEMVEIRVEMAELLLDDSWSEEEKSMIFRMQEDLNYLLARL